MSLRFLLSRIGLSCALLLSAFLLSACTPSVYPRGEAYLAPGLTKDAFVTPDGAILPYQTWPEAQSQSAPPKAIIIGLHGFNDYANAFNHAASIWADSGIRTYAFDQRGFGRAPHQRRWAGVDTMVEDAADFAALLRQKYPDIPITALGLSMGGAVLMAAEDRHPIDADRLVLVAPAVWGRATMPWYQRSALAIAAFATPWLHLSGRGLKKVPSDNIEMLRALGRDPLVIKGARVEAIWGLVNLMDAATEAGQHFRRPALILFGLKEDLIPETAWRPLIEEMAKQDDVQLRLYDKGYHMLLRDLNAEEVIADIADFALSGR